MSGGKCQGIGLWIALLLAWSQVAPAQAHRVLCYHARPKPGCSAFVLTNFGTYGILGRAPSPIRGVVDWGLMVNVSPRDAVGASVFVSEDRDGVGVGPALRYRRWIGSSQSVELAVGAPVVVGGDDYRMRTGAVFGLVKWSPKHWFAVAARPELIRGRAFVGCGPILCRSHEVQSLVRLSVGVEIGWVPGLAASPLALAAMALEAIVPSIN